MFTLGHADAQPYKTNQDCARVCFVVRQCKSAFSVASCTICGHEILKNWLIFKVLGIQIFHLVCI